MARPEPTFRRLGPSGRAALGTRTVAELRAAARTRAEQKARITTRYLIDNSVWARLSITPAVAGAFRTLVNQVSPWVIYICPPIAAEYGYSARNGAEHTLLLQQLATVADCPETPSTDDVLQLQNALWNQGLLRAVGATDLLIAAYALKNRATVVHYDHDFDHISTVQPDFKQQWIVPRGTL